MTQVKYSEVWDLEVFFKGGSDSEELRTHLNGVDELLNSLEKEAVEFSVPTSADAANDIVNLIDSIKNVALNLSQAGAVIGCFLAADTTDKKALLLQGETSTLGARFSTIMLNIQQTLAKSDDAVWNDLMKSEELKEFAFILTEWRDEVALKLSEEEESLVTTLSVDGYHGWGKLYDQLVGEIKITIDVDGEEKELSVGQANNLSSHQDADIRKESFEALEEAWTEKEEFFAKTLNHLAGFRLAVYKKRGWDSVLQEPLQINRMKQETLDAMWGAIAANKEPFVDYLKKATMLGTKKWIGMTLMHRLQLRQ